MNPRLTARFVVGVALLLLLPGAFGQSGLRIAGQAHNVAGAPVPDAQVVLTPIGPDGQPTSGGVVVRAKTNKKGKFTFAFAKPGDYQIEVEAGELVPVEVGVKLRGAERRPVYGPDGLIEDRSGPVDPADPKIRLGIPPDAFYVDIELTLGAPVAPAPAAGGSAAAQQIVVSGLGPEVEGVLAQLDSGQFEPALEEVDKLVAANAGLAPLHYLRGFALLKLHRSKEAEAALREALRLDPEIEGASGLLGQILGDEGRFDEALTALNKELEHAEEPAQRLPLLLASGQALLELKRAKEAVAPLEEARTLDPSNQAVQVQLADAYIQSGNDQAAERLLTEGMDSKQAAALHYNLAANLLRNEDWERAVSHLQQSLKLDPGVAVAHKYLAQAYLALNKRAEAVTEFEAYLAAEPGAEDAEQTRQLVAALRRILEEE